ncbi:MAG: TorF family putative porin [Pseudomonadota bacterium]
MIKKTLIATAMLASTSVAQAEISANATLATDYVFRGISQTDNQFAIQGGFDWEHASGFYLGTWASNVDSDFFGGVKDPQIELDLYGGFAGDFGDSGLGYDVGYIRYEYPGGGDSDTNEIYGALSLGGFSGQVNYSDELNFVGDDGDGWYFNAGYGTELGGVGLTASVGYSTGDAWDAIGIDNYVDWSLGASYSIVGVDLGLTYTDTNISNSDCGSSTLCDSKFIASISKSF